MPDENINFKKPDFIRLNYKFNELSSRSQNYIKDVLKLVNCKIGLNHIYSIILFGSQIFKNKEYTSISDCDLLIVLDNQTPKRRINELERYLFTLEIKHKYREKNLKFLRRILSYVQYSTGMFVSHFITKRKYCEEAVFHKIFRVNKAFSYLFTPRKIVLNSIISNHKELYGKPLHKIIKKSLIPKQFEILKSLMMNLIISFFSIGISPLKKLNAIKYQLEAVKWSLKTSNYYIFRDSKSLKKITLRLSLDKKFKLKTKEILYFKKFLQLREKPQNNLRFMLKSPFKILQIHIKAFNFKLLSSK
ncbi:MAG: hypothetical protein KGD57_07625 [Candidatus Lokiarchaeota archaeon]|nr:hypothetical protein [Candidatus Lokiarchaeota archaeon]